MKWRVKGTDGNKSFSKSAEIIIKKRIKDLLKSIKTYLVEENVDNLHRVRIALRRLRYTLEIFYSCFEKKIFYNLYEQIERLQDLSGEVRDLDILNSNYHYYLDADTVNLSEITSKIQNKKKTLIKDLGKIMKEFIHSTELKYFRNQLSERR